MHDAPAFTQDDWCNTQLACGAQVAQQEAELDEAYDMLELQLRATPCEDSHEVGYQPLYGF